MSIIFNSHSVHTLCASTSIWISLYQRKWDGFHTFASFRPARLDPFSIISAARGYGNWPFRHHHHRHSFLNFFERKNTQSFCFYLKNRRYTTKSFVRSRMGASSWTGFLVHAAFIWFVSQCYDSLRSWRCCLGAWLKFWYRQLRRVMLWSML